VHRDEANVVSGYYSQRYPQARREVVERAVRSLLPDSELWAILEVPEGQCGPILAVHNGGLYLMAIEVAEGVGTRVDCERVDLRASDVSLHVTEIAEATVNNRETRQRWWLLRASQGTLAGIPVPLTIDTEEEIEGSQAAPDRLELFARGLAGELGWHVSP